MINALYPQIMGIITRIQNYPGIKGLEEVDARVRKICRDHNPTVSRVYCAFSEGVQK